MVEARARGLTVLARAEALAAIASLKRCIAVAGTHGKTTTASMLALQLVEAGTRPSFLIGGDVNEIGTNAVWDVGEWLVVEADESDGSFLSLAPDVAVVTNVEADHLDHWGSFDAVKSAFEQFVAGARLRRVVGGDDPVAAGIGRASGADMVGTGPECTYRIVDPQLARSSISFGLVDPSGVELGRLDVPVPGLHNARNAAVATVAALAAGVPFEAAARALSRFAGVARRFEFRGDAGRGDLRGRLRPPPDRGAGRAGRGPQRRVEPGGGGVPAPPLQPDRRAGRGVRPGLRRRRPGGGHRRLRGRRGPDPGGVRAAGGRRRPSGPRRGSRWSTWPARPTCAARSRTSSSPGTSV